MYKFIRFLMLAFYKIFYRVEYINKNNIIPEGKCIITCNHLGKADVMIVGALYKDKTYFLAKKEWFNNKLFAKIVSVMGALPIDREKPQLSSIRTCLKVLKDGNRLAIFPEGTRNKVDNSLQPFKQGTVMFAVKGQAPITPIVINKRSKMFRKNYVIIGEPIDFSNYYNVPFTDELSEQLTNELYSTMLSMQQELFRYVEDKKSKKGSKKCK